MESPRWGKSRSHVPARRGLMIVFPWWRNSKAVVFSCFFWWCDSRSLIAGNDTNWDWDDDAFIWVKFPIWVQPRIWGELQSYVHARRGLILFVWWNGEAVIFSCFCTWLIVENDTVWDWDDDGSYISKSFLFIEWVSKWVSKSSACCLLTCCCWLLGLSKDMHVILPLWALDGG